jgi:hypothetical protein
MACYRDSFTFYIRVYNKKSTSINKGTFHALYREIRRNAARVKPRQVNREDSERRTRFPVSNFVISILSRSSVTTLCVYKAVPVSRRMKYVWKKTSRQWRTLNMLNRSHRREVWLKTLHQPKNYPSEAWSPYNIQFLRHRKHTGFVRECITHNNRCALNC